VSALRQELDRQHAYIARVERALAEKNQHIARLERLIHAYETGRLMRLLRALRLR